MSSPPVDGLIPDVEPELIKVLVVDDHQTFAELLALALDADPSLSFVGHARNAAQAGQLVAQLRPDVVLMDVALPDVDGITATQQLLVDHPGLRVVILTAHTEPSLVARAAAAGARGFLPKDGALRDVLQALHTAHSGGMVVAAHLLAGMLNPPQTAAPVVSRTSSGPSRDASGQVGVSAGRLTASLTAREHDVLRLMGRGMDVRAIARRLEISPHTCRGYVKSILAKLDSHSQLEAVMTAIRHGLLSPHEPV